MKTYEQLTLYKTLCDIKLSKENYNAYEKLSQ